MPWRLKLFGVAQLHSEAPRVVALSRKDAALLAYVALNGTVPSAAVAGLIWTQSGERGAMNNLRQRLHRLRRECGARLLEVTATARLADDLAVEEPPDASALETDPGAWDAELLGSCRYDDAGEFSAWLALRRSAWAAARVEALARIASEAERQGQLARALLYAQRLHMHEPLSEHVHRRLMRLHYLRGDTAAAVSAFEACERVLKDELGLKPSAETIELLGTIERGAAPPQASVAPMPATLQRPPRAVGRRAEREQLARAHADGHVAAIVGEAGMGKTRLLQDFIAAQPRAVYAQARPGDAAVPYGALARLLRAVLARTPNALGAAPRLELARVAPELGDGIASGSPGQPARLQAAIEQLLAGALGGEVRTLVVDDLHFADPASVEMLRALVDSDGLAAMRWAFAHRPVAAEDANGALLRSLADSPRARWIQLSPLTDADLVELLESLALPSIDPAAFAPALVRHTGGNPLYVLETLREARLQGGVMAGLVLPRPQSIAHMIDRRLQRLSERALALARVAALAGPDFSAELAEHALTTPALLLAGAWAELEAADVLRGAAFAHDLVRDCMLRATPQVIARHAHGLIAQYLEDRGAEPARVAEHWFAAEEHVGAAHGFRRAADRARVSGRPREQALLLQRSADAFDLAQDFESAIGTRSLALRPMLHGGELSSAEHLSERLIESAGDGPLAGLVWTRRASLLMSAGKAAQAEVAARRALALLHGEQQALQVEASAALAIACLARGSAEEGLALMRPWIDRLDAVHDPALRIEFCSAHAVLLFHLERLDEAALAVARQIELIRAAGEDGEIVAATLSLAALQLRRGEAEAALALAASAAAAQTEYDKPGVVPGYTRFLRGSALCALGRYDDGLVLLDDACEMLARTGPGTPVHSNSEVVRAEVWLQLGQAARARQSLDHDRPGLSAAGSARRRVALAAIQRRLDRRIDEALDIAGADGWTGMLLRIEAARRAAPDAAIVLCEEVRTQAGRNGDHVVVVIAAMVRLDALRMDHRTAQLPAAAFELEQLLGHCRSTLLYPPEVWLACALANEACAQHALAARNLAQALEWIRRVALPQVPPEFADGFLQRNPVNVQLRALDARR